MGLTAGWDGADAWGLEAEQNASKLRKTFLGNFACHTSSTPLQPQQPPAAGEWPFFPGHSQRAKKGQGTDPLRAGALLKSIPSGPGSGRCVRTDRDLVIYAPKPGIAPLA